MISSDEKDPLYSPIEIEWGRWLFSQECSFFRGVQKMTEFSDFDLPEVAFCGRSNVGKSSLINALTRRNTLARISITPGRTQQLNFFNLSNRLFLVDMPGYGYARVSKKTKAQWQELLYAYFRGRPTLERSYVLIDSRIGIKENDLDIMHLFDKTAVSYQIVLTKSDKIGHDSLCDLANQIETLLKKHPAAHPRVIPTSAEKNLGIAELRSEIARFTPQKQETK